MFGQQITAKLEKKSCSEGNPGVIFTISTWDEIHGLNCCPVDYLSMALAG
jgi:hypothetical protein